MVALLATCTKEEQRSVIRFLSSEGVKPIEIHREMKVQYGDACLSLQQVYKWPKKFMNGISSVTDSPQPGQAYQVVTPEAIAAVEAIMKENHHITLHEIATYLDMSHGSAHHIIHDKKSYLIYIYIYIYIYMFSYMLLAYNEYNLNTNKCTIIF